MAQVPPAPELFKGRHFDRKRVTNPRVDSGPEGAVTCELLKPGA